MFNVGVVFVTGAFCSYVPIKMSYIDPGTGSMLFTIAIGLISTLIYSFKSVFLKIKFKNSQKSIDDVAKENYNYVIFSDNKRYWNVFESICDEFEKIGIDLVYMTMSNDDEVFNKQYQHIKPQFIGKGNGAFAKLNLLSADVVISTTPGLDVFQWKRSKGVKYYVHIPHAASDITLYRMFGIDYYDAILLTGDFQVEQIRKLEELRNLPKKELVVVGCTYFDDMKLRLNSAAESNKKNENKVVLLAPSWGESGILSRFGSKMIDALLATGYKIIVRPHPQSFDSEREMLESLIKQYPNIEWNRDRDNFDVLNRSDILISDFSGVLFDYSLVFDKPVIYANTSFDKAPYDAWWLDEQLWTFKTLPNIGVELTEDNFQNIKSIIDNCLSNAEFKHGRDQARKEAWSNCLHSKQDVVEYLIRKREDLIK